VQGVEAYKDFSSPVSLRNLRYFENHYECSGVCDVPLFYLTKPLSDGPPTEDCAVAIIHSMKGKVSVVLLSLIGMISFWWAGLSAIPNCCGGNKNNMGSPMLKGKHVELSDEFNASGMNTTRDQTMIR
jgi:hypothetical protein